MPKLAKPLTDTNLKNAKPTDKLQKLSDGKGLYCFIYPHGGKLWRFRYKFNGKENTVSLGDYPTVTLAMAREKTIECNRMLANGQDPSEVKKQSKQELKNKLKGSFKEVAEEWRLYNSERLSPSTNRRNKQILDQHLIPSLSKRYVGDLTSKEGRAVIEKISKTPQTALKAKQALEQIIRFAVLKGYRDEDLPFNLAGALPKDVKKSATHFPAITKDSDIPTLIKALDGISSESSRTAIYVCLYTAVRPVIAASMRWDEIDLDRQEWHIPAEKMKGGFAHITPLPTQLVEMLKRFEDRKDMSPYIFPSATSASTKHIHRDSLSKVLRENGLQGKTVTHGFRAMLRTIGRERLDFEYDVLEAQLAHAKKGEVAAAYDRTGFLTKRHVMLQKWADFIDKQAKGKESPKVVQLPGMVA